MDLKLGLLIAASVPCTMAAASVWTRRAEGNDAVSLLVTLITNGMCFLVTPAWLSIGARWFGLADTSDAFTFGDMVLRLTLAALLPAVLGQILRINISVRFVIDKNKRRISTVAQIIILSLVFIYAFRGGRKFDGIAGSLNHAEMALTWGLCIGLHLAAMLAAWLLSTVRKFNEEDRRATVFAGSQKTLPIGILVSQASGLPLSIIPMLMFHASQLFIDTWIADRLKLGRSGVTTSETAGGEAADGQTPAQDTRSGA
jgi:sodium/bile acid cotransporter 7